MEVNDGRRKNRADDWSRSTRLYLPIGEDVISSDNSISEKRLFVKSRGSGVRDQMKSVVLHRDFEGLPVWQKDYESFMKTVGFQTKLCKPRHPFTKVQDKTAPGNWVHFSFGWVQNAQSKTGGNCAGKNVIYFSHFY